MIAISISSLLYLTVIPNSVAAPAKSEFQELQAGNDTSNRTFVVGMFRDGWPPYEINGRRGPSGLSLDYLSYIGQRLKIKWTVRFYESWPELYRAACKGEVDLLMSITPSEERRKCLEFTSEYFKAAPVVVTRRDMSVTQDLSVLGRRKIAVAREFVITDFLKQRFPTATYLEVAGPKEGLIAVSEGRADVFITNPYTARYVIASERLTNLRFAVSVPVPFDTLSFAGPRSNRLLLESMSGVIRGMSSFQHAHMRERWISSHDTQLEGLALSTTDRRYLDGLGKIKVGYLNNRSPVSFSDSLGQANGYGPSVLRQVAEQLGVALEFIPIESVSDIRKALKKDGVDIVVGLSNADPLISDFQPSMPYSTFPMVVAMRSDAQPVSTGLQIKGERVLISEAASGGVGSYMGVNGLRARTVSDADSGMHLVANGDADAYVDNLLVIDHLLQRSYAGELKVAGAPRERDELGFLISKRKPRLLSLVDRALELMPSSQQEVIRSRWTTRQPDEGISLRALWKKFGALIAAVSIGLVLLVLWQIRLQQAIARNRRLQGLLVQRSDFQQRVIDTSPHPLLAVNSEGAVLAVNSAYRSDFAGAGAGADADVGSGPFSALKEGRDIRGHEVVYMDKNGSQRIGLYWQHAFEGSMGLSGRVASLVDVTPLRRAERVARVTQLRLADLTKNFPGAVYQYRRDGEDTIAFTYVAGNPVEMFGLTAEQIVANESDAKRAVHPDDRERLTKAVLATLADNEPLLIEFRTLVGGVVRWIRSHAVPSTQVDGRTLWSGYWIDVTDKHTYQEELAEARRVAEQAVVAKGRFLAVMSHEIRTPMSGVVGLIDSLSRMALGLEQTHLVALMSESARTLSKVIDDVLDFTKLEEGQAQLDLADVDLIDLLESTASSMMGAAPKKLGCRIVVGANLAPLHLADETRIRQVLTNLIANAIKFTEHGEIVLTIRAEGSNEQRQAVSIEVRDTGIGIAPDALNRLFEPFSQGNEKIHTRYGGSGLGLSISRHLARLMGGDVSLVSTEGLGTSAVLHLELPMRSTSEKATHLERFGYFTSAQGARVGDVAKLLASMGAQRKESDDEADFIIVDEVEMAEMAARRPALCISSDRFPGGYKVIQGGVLLSVNPLTRRSTLAAVECLMDSPRSVSLAREEMPRQEQESGTLVHRPEQRAITAKGHVLVVEDHFINQQLMRHQLGSIGYTCDVVNGGAAALRALQSTTYAAVITDCQMEPVSGYEWVRRYRALESDARKRQLIIGISATPAGQDERWREAGMDQYFSRPIRLDALENALQAVTNAVPLEVERSVQEKPSLREGLNGLSSVTGGGESAITLMQAVLVSTRADIQALKGRSFHSVGQSLSMWLHTTLGVIRLLGHSELTDAASALETALTTDPRLDTIAEMADMTAAIEDWLDEVEVLLASLEDSEA